jgi:hypothetical protein
MSTDKFDRLKGDFALERTSVDAHDHMPPGLENCYRCKPIQGSNLCPSAKSYWESPAILVSLLRDGSSREDLTANLTAIFVNAVPSLLIRAFFRGGLTLQR